MLVQGSNLCSLLPSTRSVETLPLLKILLPPPGMAGEPWLWGRFPVTALTSHKGNLCWTVEYIPHSVRKSQMVHTGVKKWRKEVPAWQWHRVPVSVPQNLFFFKSRKPLIRTVQSKSKIDVSPPLITLFSRKVIIYASLETLKWK